MIAVAIVAGALALPDWPRAFAALSRFALFAAWWLLSRGYLRSSTLTRAGPAHSG
jgi:hypothetical protein